MDRSAEMTDMKRFTNSIRMSLKNKNWYGALVMALTLPDVCGKLEYPHEQSSKKRYIDWFRKWLQPEYTPRVGTNQEERVFLSGEDCYALRCSYLHEGHANIDDKKARNSLDSFHFTKPVPGLYVHNNKIDNVLQLQVDVFCEDIVNAVDEWRDSRRGNEETEERIGKLLIIHTPQSIPGIGIESPPEATG